MEKDNKYLAFQEFQKAFFTDPAKFSRYTKFEIDKHGFVLLNNISKGLPGLINYIINLKGFNFKGFNSYEILRALQNRIMNPYAKSIPNYIFYKTNKPEKVSVRKVIKNSKEYLEFSTDVKREICSILLYDDKTYEYLKYSDKVQKCGKALTGDIKQK